MYSFRNKMLLSAVFLFLSLNAAQALPKITRLNTIQTPTHTNICQETTFNNNQRYRLVQKWNVSGVPADLAINFNNGDIIFTLTSYEMKMHLEVLHSNGVLEPIKVPGLGQSSTVDNKNNVVYLATDNGVYIHGDTDVFTAKNEDVMYVAATNDGVLYIATFPQNLVHKISNGGRKQEMYPAIPNGHGLTVDAMNNVYFIATKTLYILKDKTNVPIKIKGVDDKIVSVFVDVKGDVLAVNENGKLFKVDVDNASAEFLGDFNVTGVNTFGVDGNDNVWLGVIGGLLKYERGGCY